MSAPILDSLLACSEAFAECFPSLFPSLFIILVSMRCSTTCAGAFPSGRRLSRTVRPVMGHHRVGTITGPLAMDRNGRDTRGQLHGSYSAPYLVPVTIHGDLMSSLPVPLHVGVYGDDDDDGGRGPALWLFFESRVSLAGPLSVYFSLSLRSCHRSPGRHCRNHPEPIDSCALDTI